MFDFVARWKDDFVSMFNSTFTWILMMGVFSRVCSGVLWGMRESTVSVSGRGQFMYLCLVLCLVIYKQSLTAYMCWFGVWWGHRTDVPRTGCARMGSETRRVSFYVSMVGGGLRLSGPSSGTNGSVRVYRRVNFGKQNL